MLFVCTLRFTAKTRKRSNNIRGIAIALWMGNRLAAGLLGLESDWEWRRGDRLQC